MTYFCIRVSQVNLKFKKTSQIQRDLMQLSLPYVFYLIIGEMNKTICSNNHYEVQMCLHFLLLFSLKGRFWTHGFKCVPCYYYPFAFIQIDLPNSHFLYNNNNNNITNNNNADDDNDNNSNNSEMFV